MIVTNRLAIKMIVTNTLFLIDDYNQHTCISHRNDYNQHIIHINRGSYMSAHVLLNLLNEMWKRDKMRGLPSILSFFSKRV